MGETSEKKYIQEMGGEQNQLDQAKNKIFQVLNDNNYEILQYNTTQNTKKEFILDLPYLELKGLDRINNKEVLIKLSDGTKESFLLLKNELKIKSKLNYSNTILVVQNSFILEAEEIAILIYEWSNESLENYLENLMEKDKNRISIAVNVFLSLLNQLVEYNLYGGFVSSINPIYIFRYSDGQFRFSSQILDENHVQFLDNYIVSSFFGSNVYLPPDLIVEKGNFSISEFSNTYSMGMIFLDLLGIEKTAENFQLLKERKFYEKERLDLSYSTYIKSFMIKKQAKNRYRAIHLQQLLLQFDKGHINIQEEQEKAQGVIQICRDENVPENLFLANQYNYLSLCTQTIDKENYSKKAIQILIDTNETYQLEFLFYARYQFNEDFDFKEKLNYELIKKEKSLQIAYTLLMGQVELQKGNTSKCILNLNYLLLQKVQNPFHPMRAQIILILVQIKLTNADFANIITYNSQDAWNIMIYVLNKDHQLYLDYYRCEYDKYGEYNSVILKIDALNSMIQLYDNLKGIDYKLIATTYSQLGFYYNHIRNLENGLESLNKSIDFYKKYYKTDKHKKIAETMRNIGFNILYRGDLQKALECDLEVLKMREEIEDKEGILESLQDVCISYRKVREFKKAILIRQRRFKINIETNQEVAAAEDAFRIGNLYQNDYQCHLAAYYFKHAIQLEKSNMNNNTQRIEQCLYNLNECNLSMNDYEEAEIVEFQIIKIKHQQ